MKGMTGLIVAAALGIAGAVCNWIYVEGMAQVQEQTVFIGVKNDVQLNVGDILKDDILVPVPIPATRIGILVKTCPPWSAKDAFIGQAVNRPISGGDILLHQDLRTPSQQDLSKVLLANEVARWVPIDPRTVVTEQINPGDDVSFEIARGTASPVNADPATDAKPAPATSAEIIGPFRVLALGSRREAPDISRAGRGRTGPENTITIAVQLEGDHLESKAARLFDGVRRQGNSGASVLLHSARARK